MRYLIIKIAKRDGRRVPFEGKKIYNAVHRASEACGRNAEECDAIATKIQEELEKKYIIEKNGKRFPTVEQIQDDVVNALIHEGKSDIIHSYVTYRAERTMIREMKSELNKVLKELTFSDSKESNLKRDNGNVNGDTSMGMMLQIGSATSKEFTERFILSESTKKAVEDGAIYIHDKDFYPMGTLTCCQIPLDRLFEKGFNTGHGTLRPPQSIGSYASLAAVAIQANQNEMHGGQAIPLFDFYLAPGVAKSFKRNFIRILETVIQYNKEMTATKFRAVKDTLNQKELSFWYQSNFTSSLFQLEEMLEECSKTLVSNLPSIWYQALERTDEETFQAMEGFVHNLNTLHSRAGSQVPFSSVNYGMDTSEEGRMVCRNLMLAQEAGLGNGETPIFPILIFQVKEGVNYNPEDPNYDLFKLSFRVSAKRLFPNYVFVDAPFNLQYYDEKDPETIIATMGCVDGKETIYYIYENKIYNEPFEVAWERLKFEVKQQGASLYKDLDNVFIYDSDSFSFVHCYRMIKNPDRDNWLRFTFADGKTLTVTDDHPMYLKNKGRVYASATKIRDVCYGVNYYGKREHPTSLKESLLSIQYENEIIKIDKLGNRGRFSYDVTTESDMFDVSGILSHNCRTRVIGNVNGKQTPVGRGNLSFTTINLPRLGIKHGIQYRKENGIENSLWDKEGFFKELDELLNLCSNQLYERYCFQKKKHINNFPFLMGQRVWSYEENKKPEDELDSIIDSGTLSVGFIGLAECLKALTGNHHGECPEAQELGLEIIQYMRQKMDEMTEETHLNYSLLGTPAEGLSGFFTRIDQRRYGLIPGVTDREYYTNSFHIPVYYPTDFVSKIRTEAPYHALTNAGHITYVEMDGNPEENIEAFESIIRCMKESGIGYGSINHAIDRDPVCGYTGVIEGDNCPGCGRDIKHRKIRSGEFALEKLMQEGENDIYNTSGCNCK